MEVTPDITANPGSTNVLPVKELNSSKGHANDMNVAETTNSVQVNISFFFFPH